jgi:hypothetical protein
MGSSLSASSAISSHGKTFPMFVSLHDDSSCLSLSSPMNSKLRFANPWWRRRVDTSNTCCGSGGNCRALPAWVSARSFRGSPRCVITLTIKVRAPCSTLSFTHSMIVFMMSALASPASVVRGPLPIHLDTLSRVASLSHKYSRSTSVQRLYARLIQIVHVKIRHHKQARRFAQLPESIGGLQTFQSTRFR